MNTPPPAAPTTPCPASSASSDSSSVQIQPAPETSASALVTHHPSLGTSPQGELSPAPGESARAFEAFGAYLELGPRRRYAAVARQVGVSLRTIKRWAIDFDWRGRLNTQSARAAKQFTQARDAELLEISVREKAFFERQFLLAEAILDVTERYFERMEDMDFEHVRLADVCRALEFASRLASQARQPEVAAAPDTGLRDQLASLLDQAFRETPKTVSP